jgi:uncharacterized C2H2 Zn-finger protein
MKTKSNAGTQKKLDGSGKKVVRNTSNRLKVQQSLIKKQSDEIARLRSLLLGELKNKRGLWSLSSVGPQPHKPFKCEKCDATFTRKDKVARHIREIHEGIKRARNVAKEKLRNRSGESARRWAKMKEQHDLDPELKKKRQLEVAERTKLYRQRKIERGELPPPGRKSGPKPGSKRKHREEALGPQSPHVGDSFASGVVSKTI